MKFLVESGQRAAVELAPSTRGKGGKGQPAHAFASQASATGSSWLNPRSGHLDLAGFQSASRSPSEV